MNRNDNNQSRAPFWMPWGIWGFLWRTLVFLAGLILLSFLFALLRDGDFSGESDDPAVDPAKPFGRLFKRDPYKDLPIELRDTSIVREWFDSIPGVPELPAPKDNYIPPVDSTRIIVNPVDSSSYVVCDELIVFFNSRNLKQDMADFTHRYKHLYPSPAYTIPYYNPVIGTMLLSVPEDELLQVAEELPRKITDIDFKIATNEVMEQSAVPSDPDFRVGKYDEYFKLIQAYDAWDITQGSEDVKVAVVDSYFDLSNPEIGERYVDRIHIPSKTRMVLPPAQSPTVDDLTVYCHGSHVAGIAIGAQNNGRGCSGIAPKCTWIPIALGNQMTAFNLIEGILYAVYNGADVVNFSIGKSYPSEFKDIPIGDQIEYAENSNKMGEELWEYIIKTANDHNCVLCTSAGNNSLLMGLDPKNRSLNIIKVEAVDNRGQIAEFSNFGEISDAGVHYSTVSAPGVDLWSVSDKRCAGLWKKFGYKVSAQQGFQEMSGTSMASPVVAGAVALLKSKNRNLTTEQIIKILTMTGKYYDKSRLIGPTIQIKDALDATGGDLANFDDLMNDHDLLIGKWKSTHELRIADKDDNKVDDIWTYFIFTSPTAGRIEHHTINMHTVYSARLKVTWGTDKIEIRQLEEASTPQGETLVHDDFICRPDKDRLLNATCIKPGNKEAFTFQLEKVN